MKKITLQAESVLLVIEPNPNVKNGVYIRHQGGADA